MELLESRIYTFVDSTKRFAFYFLEGQQLIRELALIHPLQGGGLCLLSGCCAEFHAHAGLAQARRTVGPVPRR
jgi:hypothetical protein